MVQPASTQDTNTKMKLADLSGLCNFGMIEDEINIGGFNFKLRTLTAKEQEECLACISGYNLTSLALAAALQNQTLTRALVSVNSVPIEKLPHSLDIKEGDSLRLAIIGSFQDALKRKLYDFYQSLSEKSDNLVKELSAEDLKG